MSRSFNFSNFMLFVFWGIVVAYVGYGVGFTGSVVYGRDACVTTAADELVIGKISIGDVVIEGISEGKVTYLLGNRSSTRPVDAVILYFDEVPALRKGEVALAAGDYVNAVKFLRAALRETEISWQRAWVFYRLALVYDGMGEYTNAVGVWAELITASPESYWIIALPVCEPDYADGETVARVLKLLGEARRVVTNTILTPTIDEMIKQVKWIGDREPPAKDVVEDKDETTDTDAEEKEISGNEVNNNDSNTNRNKPVINNNKMNNNKVPGRTEFPVVLIEGGAGGTAAGGELANRIDKLLNDGKFELAKRELEKLVAEPGVYPLDRLLYQYGLVLRGTGYTQEALVRFLQCGILFESSEYAAASFCEVGEIYLIMLHDQSAGGLQGVEKVRITKILLKAKGLAETCGGELDLIVGKVEELLEAVGDF